MRSKRLGGLKTKLLYEMNRNKQGHQSCIVTCAGDVLLSTWAGKSRVKMQERKVVVKNRV